MKKGKISQNYNFSEHFYVILLTSQLPVYQLTLFLNNRLKVGFRKLPDLMVFHPKKTERLPHSFYGWSSPNAIDYFLVTSSEKSAALSSDTLLLIEKRERKETVDRFIEKIASFEFIFSVKEIPFNAPTTTPKQRQLVEQLSNITIDIEEHLDALNKKPETLFL